MIPQTLPSRYSDAGPVSRKHCPKCGAAGWCILGACKECGRDLCDLCPDATDDGKEITCKACQTKAEEAGNDFSDWLWVAEENARACGRIEMDDPEMEKRAKLSAIDHGIVAFRMARELVEAGR